MPWFHETFPALKSAGYMPALIYYSFWHIQNFIYLGIFKHTQAYSVLLRHIHA